MLSQHFGEKPNLHLVAFFSMKFSLAEITAGITTLAITSCWQSNWCLVEWHHWLEGAALTFIIFTDHKNLEYLKTVKQLNPHQTRWALFFTCLWCMLSY